ncbi:MAG: hypothetical protein KA731_02190 [Candidatus Moranbacteria bacterium]|nr:hypothetical protein [Candidatus Moranbacteria bacterium]MBP6034365.1 hypothetical protein [Candidatus Moranbacteria bacterium]MBP7696085.1 hypothetical protein [Candidatus Moranbacteria bacterium]
MPSLIALSQMQWSVLGISLILFFFLFQRLRVRTAVAQRQHDGWHALPESSGITSYRASGCEDHFIADLTDHFPGRFSDEDRQWMRLFLEGLPGDMTIFLRLAPVRIHSESRDAEPMRTDSALPPLQDFWIQSLSVKGAMACYESVFTIPPVHQPDSQRLVFARPEEDGRDDTILVFVPKYVMR